MKEETRSAELCNHCDGSGRQCDVHDEVPSQEAFAENPELDALIEIALQCGMRVDAKNKDIDEYKILDVTRTGQRRIEKITISGPTACDRVNRVNRDGWALSMKPSTHKLVGWCRYPSGMWHAFMVYRKPGSVVAPACAAGKRSVKLQALPMLIDRPVGTNVCKFCAKATVFLRGEWANDPVESSPDSSGSASDQG